MLVLVQFCRYIFYSTVGTLSDKVKFNIVEMNNNMKLAIRKKTWSLFLVYTAVLSHK
jgi:hypothetical protein